MSDIQDPAPPPPPSSPPPPPSSPPPPGPPPPAAAPRADGPRLPWVERERLGFVNAFVETAKLIVQQPAEAFSRIRADADYVSPLLFGGLVMLASTLVNILFSLFWGMIFSRGSGMGSLAVAGGLGVFMTFVVLVIAPFVIVIAMFLFAGIFHGILSLTGGLEASRVGFEGTFKVTAYAMLSSILGIVPVIGPLLSIVALGYLCYLGLPRAHGCTDRHALYAIAPLALCGVCGGLGMILNTLRAIF